jgi:P4 family phage/plasmid primase-like protien
MKTVKHVKANPSFSEYVKSRIIRKGDPDSQNLVVTNTRIGDKDSGVIGGSYHIPDDEYGEFMKIYFKDIIAKNEKEYLTEKQLETDGPIAIDVDLRYDYAVAKRQHTQDHTFDLAILYLEELQKMFQFEEGVKIPVFIFEKTDVNRLQEKQITKDGIHIIIGLKADRTVQTMLRERIIRKIPSVWTDLPLKNSWEEVFDEGISKGCVNWQLYGSRKPNHQPYRLKYAYTVELDIQDNELMMPSISPSAIETEDRIFELSVRYRDHPSLFMKSDFLEEYESRKGGESQKRASSSGLINHMNTFSPELMTMSHEAVLSAKTREQLAAAVSYFLESIQPDNYEIREAHDYTMALPESYYGAGSFSKWIRVGWCLRNISDKLFIVWVAFSAQSSTFSFATIRDDMWHKWTKFNMNDPNGLTKGSLMYWVKQDSLDKFKEIRKLSVDYYIDQTLTKMQQNSDGDSKVIRGCGDFDIAYVLYQQFKGDYVCVSVKANVWYKYSKNRWEENDSGTALRMAISTKIRKMYVDKSCELMRKTTLLDADSELCKNLKEKARYAISVADRLGKTSDKKNIMIEAKELFYDNMLLQHLDSNPYLMCFENGVIDFKTKMFRNGIPEDYLSKCTRINYVALDDAKHAHTVSEITDFMHKLFPNPDLCRYMWDHLASTLIGNNVNQTFNMYKGIGQNGKSVLVKLMEKILGDYKGDVPLTLITSQRPKIGGVTPELVQLKGVRYAVMQEPSKGDKMNEGIMKQLTGGDPMQGRAPYMTQMVSFVPQFKLVVCSNEFLEIKTQDHGTWRRIRLVEFESLFTENPVHNDPEKPYQFKLDKKIDDKFEDWREVFMAMLVKRAFETNGLVEDCDKVLASSKEYRKNQDYIAEFIADRIMEHKNGCLQKTLLVSTFKEWYNAIYGNKHPSTKDVIAYFDKEYGKAKNNVWHGLKIKHETDMSSIAETENGEGEDDNVDYVEDIDLQEL